MHPIHDVHQIMGFSWVWFKFPNNFWDYIKLCQIKGFLYHLSAFLIYTLEIETFSTAYKITMWKVTIISPQCPGNKLVAVFWTIFTKRRLRSWKKSEWKCFLVGSTSKTTMRIIIHIFLWKLRTLMEFF